MRYIWLLFMVACTNEKGLPEIYLLQGPCQITVSTNEKHSNIFIDGILIGHGEAKTHVPCGEKKIQVEAEGKKNIEDYQTIVPRSSLELSYKLEKASHVHDWAMSGEFVEQLKKGQGPYDHHDKEYKEIAAAKAREIDEQGYNYTAKELAAANKKLLGGDEAAAAGGGAIVIDPNTNFDDPKTWL